MARRGINENRAQASADCILHLLDLSSVLPSRPWSVLASVQPRRWNARARVPLQPLDHHASDLFDHWPRSCFCGRLRPLFLFTCFFSEEKGSLQRSLDVSAHPFPSFLPRLNDGRKIGSHDNGQINKQSENQSSFPCFFQPRFIVRNRPFIGALRAGERSIQTCYAAFTNNKAMTCEYTARPRRTKKKNKTKKAANHEYNQASVTLKEDKLA